MDWDSNSLLATATMIQSYSHPQGWQAVVRDDRKEQKVEGDAYEIY